MTKQNCNRPYRIPSFLAFSLLFLFAALWLTACTPQKNVAATGASEYELFTPKEFFPGIAEYNETIDIGKYIPKEDMGKILKVIEEYAIRNYGMGKDEYVVTLRVMIEGKGALFYSYLLSGEKISEGRTLFSATGKDPDESERRLSFYMFDVLGIEDLKTPRLGWGPRSFRLFIDRTSLTVVTGERVSLLEKAAPHTITIYENNQLKEEKPASEFPAEMRYREYRVTLDNGEVVSRLANSARK